MMHDRHQTSLGSTTWQQFRERKQAFADTGEDVDYLLVLKGDEVVGWLDLRVR
jgi:hypothetical protein